jgi:hypothetical protein
MGGEAGPSLWKRSKGLKVVAQICVLETESDEADMPSRLTEVEERVGVEALNVREAE